LRAFEVYLNGKKLCVAGIGHDGVLSAIVNWVAKEERRDLFLEVGGLVSPTRERVAWIGQNPLHVGDEIQVRIVERRTVDKPAKRYQSDSPRERRVLEKAYVRAMAKKFGWPVKARSKAK
jgi:hypothetical protein